MQQTAASKIFFSTIAGENLKSPTKKDEDVFLTLMDNRQGSVVTSPDVLEQYNTDWTKKYRGRSQIVLRPKTTKEVSSILQYCNGERIGAVPQAGNTGLVGGSVPISDEVVLSINGLNEIEGLDESSGVLKCFAGCILQDLQNYSSKSNHLIPVDLGAKGTCRIGGNVSTNAGGQYFYRYGSLHANVLGLEVVLPDGRVLDLISSVNLKDNTGYDLKHLFIGAEGTLGVITKVALLCPRLPQARNAAFLACDSFQAVQQTLALAKDVLGEVLAAFEYMDRAVMDFVRKEKDVPIKKECGDCYEYYVLLETHGSNNDHDSEKMESFLQKATEKRIVVDGAISQDMSQLNTMWEVREACNPSIKSAGYNWKYDISLRVSEFDDLIEEMRHRLSGYPNAKTVNWGHVIDGNLHFNVTTPGEFDENNMITQLIEPFIFESVMRRGGSISAEHGLGQCKNNYLKAAKDETALLTMTSIKSLFDPNGIMNPGKFLPTE